MIENFEPKFSWGGHTPIFRANFSISKIAFSTRGGIIKKFLEFPVQETFGFFVRLPAGGG